VVWVSRENGEGAVDLLGEDGAGELVRQGDAAEREEQVGAAPGLGRPAVRRADGEDDCLRVRVAEGAEVLGEVFAGELLAAAVEQDELGCRAAGLTIEPGLQGGFGGEELRFAGVIASGAGEEVVGERCCGRRLWARTGRRDGSQDQVHVERVSAGPPKVVYEISYICTMKCRGVGIGSHAGLKTVTKLAEFRGELLCMVTVCEMEGELLLACHTAVPEEVKSSCRSVLLKHVWPGCN
jgi:hypothetical protein